MKSTETKTPVTSPVFISCSSQDITEVKKFIEFLRSKISDVDIYCFCDGTSEDHLSQQVRYQAVDSSQCLLAFLTSDYFTSRTCLEEFNIGLAKHVIHNAFFLLPIYTGAVEQIPCSLSSVPCVDASGGEAHIEILAEIVAQILKQFKNAQENFDTSPLREKLEEKRTSEFTDKFRLDGGNVTWNTASSTLDYGITGHIVFMCAQDCLTFAAILSVIVKQHAPCLTCELRPEDSKHDEGEARTTADLVVFFISDQLASSCSLNTELHMSLSQRQVGSDKTLVYFIQSQHHQSSPLFLHVLPISVCLEDKIWRRLERACSNRNPRYTANLDNVQGLCRCTAAQNLALSAAAFDIIHTLCQRGSESSTRPNNIVGLANQDNKQKGLKDETVSVHEYIISLDSLSHTVTQKATSLASSQPTSAPNPELPSSAQLAPRPADHDLPNFASDEHFAASSSDASDNLTISQGVMLTDKAVSYDIATGGGSHPVHSNMMDIEVASEGIDAGGFSFDMTDQSQMDTLSSRTSVTSVATISSLDRQNAGDDDDERNNGGGALSNVTNSLRQFSVTCHII